MQTPEKIIHSQHGQSYLLDFLLVIETFNHIIIEQTPTDVSRFDPKKSFWHDIKDLAEQRKIKKAALIGKGQSFVIDLVYGFAEINGQIMHAPKPPPVGSKFKLIYYRLVEQNLIRGVAKGVQDKKLGPKVRYYIGWQVEGSNNKWTLGVD